MGKSAKGRGRKRETTQIRESKGREIKEREREDSNRRTTAQKKKKNAKRERKKEGSEEVERRNGSCFLWCVGEVCYWGSGFDSMNVVTCTYGYSERRTRGRSPEGRVSR